MMWHFLIISFFVKYVVADPHLVLSVLPFGKNIVLEESGDLNLTCKVKSPGRPSERFDLSWKLPTRSNANGDRITVYETDDQLTVTIHNLQEDDSGLYVCELQNNGIIRTRKISVFVKSRKCLKDFFDCGNGSCVRKHYVCDGYVDCPSGYDESFNHCGPDACHGKIWCDGRCIPKELCCDPAVDTNCTVNYIMPCCYAILHPDLDSSPCPASVDCHFGHIIGYGNSVIYVVASCAAVVMVVSIVVMFLAYRICSQRSEDMQRWSRVSESELRRQCFSSSLNHRDIESLENVDFLSEDVNSNSDQYSGSRDVPEYFVLMNFVEGRGFEVADCRPKPPPYTENTIGIPPPPYESTSDIANADKDSVQEHDSDSVHETSEQ